jgi:hypothetical protein
MISLEDWELRPSTSTLFVTNPHGSYGVPVIHRPGCWIGMPDYPSVDLAAHGFDVLQSLFDDARARDAAGQLYRVQFCQSCTIRKRES